MSCEAFRDELSAWLDGELPEARAAAVGAHLEACAGCAARLEALRGVDRALRAVPLPELSPGAFAALGRRLASAPAAGRAPRRSRRRWAGLAVAAAAALALYLAVGLPGREPGAPDPAVARRPAPPEAAPSGEPGVDGATPEEPGVDWLDGATPEELAVALELETTLDLDVIANLELLEALADLDAGTG